MKSASFFLAPLFMLLCGVFTSALACPDGQSQGAFGWCYPNVGGTVGQVFEGAKKGDLNAVAHGLGDATIAVTCPMCALAGKALLSNNDQTIVSTLIGRGLILSGIGVPPSLVLFDAAGNVTQAIQARHQPPPIISPAPSGRGTLTYKAITIAACAVLSGDNQITVGWTTPPVVVNVSSGTQSTYPNVDLREKDNVSITSNPCPETNVAQGGSSITDSIMSYMYSETIPGPDSQIKYLFIGSKIK